ncbi:LuxR C-terminal-related transcriptional regulator [Marinifilum sp. RC60d5]|uniref:LuxR C-terminal-related transcriptional regulator n=1 Tax=Marinifilum sp. RC60d5 TaxID=3458414 RepID=UPI004037057A
MLKNIVLSIFTLALTIPYIMPKCFFLIVLLLSIIFSGLCSEKTDSLIHISNLQSGKKLLYTNLKIAEEFAYGNNGDTILFYATKCNRQASVLNDSIALLKSKLFWCSGLYSNKKYQESLQKLEEAFYLSNKLNRSKEKLQALYLQSRNYQGLHRYDLAIKSFISGYKFSLDLIKTKQTNVAENYFSANLKQLSYTYWYASKLNEGIQFFLDNIKQNSDLNDRLLRHFYSNISFLYNRGIDFSKAEAYLLKAAKISKESKNSDFIYMDQAYLGALYSNIGETNKAINHYQNALQIAKKENDIFKISYILQNLGLCYDIAGDLKKGVDMIFDGIKFFIEKEDTKATAKAYQQLGRLMIKWHNYKDADKYLHKAIKLHKHEGLYTQTTIDYVNLSISKIQQQDKDSSAFYLDILKKISTKYDIKNAISSYYLSKSYTYLHFENNPEKALKTITKGNQIASQINSKALKTYGQKLLGEYYLSIHNSTQAKNHFITAWKNHSKLSMIKDQVEIAKALSQTYSNINKTDSALFFLKKADSLNYKLHHREDVLLLYKKDNDFAIQMAKREKDKLTKENKKLFNRIILIRTFYILLSLLVISLLMIYIRKRNKKLKLEIHTKTSEHKKLIKQSEIDKSTIEKTQLLIEKKENIISELKEKLLSNKSDFESKEEFNEAQALLNTKLATEEDWEKYMQLFTKRNPCFIPELKKRYPALTRNEHKIFTLLKLGLSTREMAGILMISPSSVNTARYRLRKKLNLKANEKLEDVIEDLVNVKC